MSEPLLSNATAAASFAPRFVDAHCHLGFMADGDAVAAAARSANVGMLEMTVVPEDYDAAARRFEPFENVSVGAGFHPWWAAESRRADRLETLEAAIARTQLVGEVGLDFGSRCVASREEQLFSFRAAARACAREGRRVVSIHAVRAADAALDILEEEGCLASCICVMHWFSGTSDELARAVRAGCLFSVGDRMLASKRGRAYASAVPLDRILLETDKPSVPVGEGAGTPRAGEARQIPSNIFCSFTDIEASLREACRGIAMIRREDPERTLETISQTGKRIFDRCRKGR